jgi:hypothetical protein
VWMGRKKDGPHARELRQLIEGFERGLWWDPDFQEGTMRLQEKLRSGGDHGEKHETDTRQSGAVVVSLELALRLAGEMLRADKRAAAASVKTRRRTSVVRRRS